MKISVCVLDIAPLCSRRLFKGLPSIGAYRHSRERSDDLPRFQATTKGFVRRPIWSNKALALTLCGVEQRIEFLIGLRAANHHQPPRSRTQPKRPSLQDSGQTLVVSNRNLTDGNAGMEIRKTPPGDFSKTCRFARLPALFGPFLCKPTVFGNDPMGARIHSKLEKHRERQQSPSCERYSRFAIQAWG